MPTSIRVLSRADAPAYREVRLRALRECPTAFATTADEEEARPLDEVAARLEPGPRRLTLGAFEDGRLIGVASLIRPAKERLRHRATLAAAYVAPEARGRGAGRALLDAALAAARAWGVSDVALAVTVGNDAARGLYAGAGFERYGVEPRGVRVDGRDHDVEWMNLRIG